MSAGYVLVAAGTADADAVVAAKYNVRLKGYAVSETAGSAAAAEVQIMHGATAAGGELCIPPINLAADGFGSFTITPDGIPCPNGISIKRPSGNTTIVLYVDRV